MRLVSTASLHNIIIDTVSKKEEKKTGLRNGEKGLYTIATVYMPIASYNNNNNNIIHIILYLILT